MRYFSGMWETSLTFSAVEIGFKNIAQIVVIPHLRRQAHIKFAVTEGVHQKCPPAMKYIGQQAKKQTARFFITFFEKYIIFSHPILFSTPCGKAPHRGSAKSGKSPFRRIFCIRTYINNRDFRCTPQ